MKLISEIKSARLAGVIIAGGGLNLRAWADEAKSQGYAVVYADGRALLYATGKTTPKTP